MGLDSKIVVWSGFTFERLKTLITHSSHVKGICFDPANKYFATASDDRTLKIFRFTPPTPTSSSHDQQGNFMLETTISDPYVKSPLTTYFRRCSWSPNGQHIATANAVNGPVSAVAVIHRGSWDSTISLIGHENPTEVCAFAPVCFVPVGDKAGPPITIIACAGQDKTLSLWRTTNSKPLFVSHELAAKSITDLAWTPDASGLFTVSLDGSVAFFEFAPGELGDPESEQEAEEQLAKFGGARRGAGILDSADSLLLEEISREGEQKAVEGRMGQLMGTTASETNGVSSARANGIEPLVVKAADPASNTDMTEPGALTAAAKRAEDIARLKSRVTVTKDGKRRIAPLLVNASGGAPSLLPQSLMVGFSGQAGSNPQQGVLDLSNPFDALPKGGLMTLLFGNRVKPAVTEGDQAEFDEARLAATSKNGAVPIMINGVNGLVQAKTTKPRHGQEPTPEYIRPAVINPSLIVSQTRLAVPKVPPQIARSLGLKGILQDESRQGASDQPRVTFQVTNSHQAVATGRSGDREPTRITALRGVQVLWQDFLPRSVLLVTGNRNYWVAACEDGSLVVWTPNGRRLLCPLVLESQPVILDCMGWWLLCISATGLCHVWNLQTFTSPHPPVSLAPVLDAALHPMHPNPSKGPAIQSARLSSQGRIVISVSNGDGFCYSPAMFTWQRLSEGWWMGGSQYWNGSTTSLTNVSSDDKDRPSYDGKDDVPQIADVSAGIIMELERRTTQECLFRGRAHYLQRMAKLLATRDGFESMETSVSISHLENRLVGALELGARDEFRAYLYMYAKAIGSMGKRGKVQELLTLLLGDVYEHDGDSKQVGSESFGGWPRKELLRDVVLIFGKQRDLQKLVAPYASLLGLTGKRNDGGVGDDDGMML